MNKGREEEKREDGRPGGTRGAVINQGEGEKERERGGEEEEKWSAEGRLVGMLSLYLVDMTFWGGGGREGREGEREEEEEEREEKEGKCGGEGRKGK